MQILSYNPEEDTFFIGLSQKEFEHLAADRDIEYEKSFDFEQTLQRAFKNQGRESYAQMIRDAYGIQCVPFVCVAVDRDASKIAVRESHFPFAPLWNGYSPWKIIKPQSIDNLEELKTIKFNI